MRLFIRQVNALFTFFCCASCYPWIILFMLSEHAIIAQNDAASVMDRDVLGIKDINKLTDTEAMQVVSASRTSKNLNDLPFTVYIVTREEILKNQYVTLVDVLRHVPGMRVSQPGSGENGETFLMRGLYGNYFTKILINNLPVQPSTLSGMPIGAQLPIRQAERIEIIYGPASAIYGADAVAGVINIITKTTENPTYAQADASFGQFGYSYLNFTVGGKAGKNKNILKYSVYGSSAQRRDLNLRYKDDLFNPLNYLQQNKIIFELDDGRTFQPKEITEELLKQIGIPLQDFLKNVYNPYYQGTLTQPVIGQLSHHSRMMGVEMNYRGFRLSYENMYRRDHGSIGQTPYYYTYTNPLNYLGETIQRAALSYETSFKRLSSTTNLSYLRFRLDNNSSFGITYDINYDSTAIPNTGNAYRYMASDDLMAEQLFTVQVFQNLEVVLGGSFQYSGNFPGTNDLRTPFDPDNYKAFSTKKPPSDPYYGDFGFNPLTFTNVAGFLQGYFTFGKSSFIAGLRADHNSIYGGTVNPRAAFLYKLTNRTSVKASFGTAFRAPATSITYGSIAVPQHDSISYQIIPNPDLKPEYLKAYELGVRHVFTDKISLDLSGYFNEIDNLIYSSIGPFDPKNFPKAVPYSVSNVFPYYARRNVNSEGAKAWLFGVQSTLDAQNLIPAIKLHTGIHLSYAKGAEELPENDRTITEGIGKLPNENRYINDFRMMPRWLGQLTIDFEPIPDIYFRLDHVITSSWIRRYIPDAASYQDPYYTVNGYYTLDMLGSYDLNKFLRVFIKAKNVFNTLYAGIEPTGVDIDLPYNPQPGRTMQIGLSFKME